MLSNVELEALGLNCEKSAGNSFECEMSLLCANKNLSWMFLFLSDRNFSLGRVLWQHCITHTCKQVLVCDMKCPFFFSNSCLSDFTKALRRCRKTQTCHVMVSYKSNTLFAVAVDVSTCLVSCSQRSQLLLP